jgi:hypothetical protein
MSGFSPIQFLPARAAHNAVINGGMDVSQENGATVLTLTNNTAKYVVDMVEAMYNHAAATAVVTSQQLAAASFPAVMAGFSFGHQIKATTAITSPASGDFGKHRLKIEGYRIAKWGWGATGAAAIVVAFELYSTASGTAMVKLSNSDQSRCYYHEITVAAGWNFITFQVPGDTSGTWQATTSAGLVFEVFVSGKETTPAASLDAWGATNKVQTTNSTNLLATNNNVTILTGVYIDVGAQLPVATDLPLLMRAFAEEILLCKRYWEKSYDYGTAVGTASVLGTGMIIASSALGATTAGNVGGGTVVPFKVTKRAAPSMVPYDYDGTANAVRVYPADGKRAGVTAVANPTAEGQIQFFSFDNSSATAISAGNQLMFGWTSDARL